MPPITLNENATKFYTDSEIELLIEDLSIAAKEAIEKAASEAAKAAALDAIDRESAALREAQRWKIEAQNNLNAIKETKKKAIKNIVIGVVIGITGGLAVGIGGTLIIGSR